MSREAEILKRIEQNLVNEGLSNQRVWERSDDPDLDSYFDFMVEMRLQGLNPTTQEVWEHQKRIINRLTRQAVNANYEYEKLQRDYRNLRNEYEDLVKGR